MANRKRYFSSSVLAFSFAISCVFSCQSAPKDAPVAPPATEAEIPAAPEKKTVTATDDSTPSFDLSLSSGKAPDGSLLFVHIHPLVEFDSTTLRIRLEGEEYPVFPVKADSKDFGALVAIPFNSKPRMTQVDLSWTQAGKKRAASVPFEVIDGKYRSETLSVDEKKVSPPKKEMKRILREMKLTGAVYKTISPEKYWDGPFELPIRSDVTSPFGNKRIYNGHMKNFHQGLDLRARTPTPIAAPAGAKVALAQDLYFSGGTIILDHGYGLFTTYMHMSKLQVKVGDIVKKGTVLGLSGATGRVSGPHLHWGAVLMKQKFNPQDLTRVLR